MRSSGWMLAGIGGIVIGALVCLGGVLEQDISTGRSYPRCSSLRVDPLGSKAFYEALSKTPGITCERNFHPLAKLQGRRDATLLMLGVQPWDLKSGDRLDGDDILRWVNQGGRVVITLATFYESAKKHGSKSDDEDKSPDDGDDASLTSHDFDHMAILAKRSPKGGAQDTPDKASKSIVAPSPSADDKTKTKDKDKDSADPKEKKEDEKDKDKDKEKPSDDDSPEKSNGPKRRSLSEALGFRIAGRAFVLTPKGGEDLTWAREFAVPRDDRPKWYSKAILESELEDGVQNPWKVWATEKKDAVLIERHIGRGSVVVASDSYFTTNEALYREPHPGFLTWALGSATDLVIFDETHLGVSESPGMMTLAVRHHLHGLFIGGFVLFMLILWQGHSTLVPRLDVGDRERRNITSGFSATAGFVSLLRRGLPRSRLLRQCLEQWEHSHKELNPAARARLEKAQAIVSEEEAKPKRQRSAHLAYSKICAVLHSKH